MYIRILYPDNIWRANTYNRLYMCIYIYIYINVYIYSMHHMHVYKI